MNIACDGAGQGIEVSLWLYDFRNKGGLLLRGGEGRGGGRGGKRERGRGKGREGEGREGEERGGEGQAPPRRNVWLRLWLKSPWRESRVRYQKSMIGKTCEKKVSFETRLKRGSSWGQQNWWFSYLSWVLCLRTAHARHRQTDRRKGYLSSGAFIT